MKDFLLILLGALISCGTTCFLDWLKFKREEKSHFKRQKEEIFNRCSEILFRISICGYDGMDKYLNELIVICSKLRLYVSKKVFDKFKEIFIDFQKNKNISQDKEKEFINILRKDLNIKD